jgi:hypothetical protein
MKRHIGSTIALILGGLSFASGVNSVSGVNVGSPSGLVAGPLIILGALAYRSAKKRKLGEVKNTPLRKGLEVLELIMIAAVILLQNDLKNLIATEPVTNLIIPLWAIIAYTVVVFKTRNKAKKMCAVSKDDQHFD